MNSRLYKILIFLVVFLVCSITPASAIQNHNNNIKTSDDDYIDLFNETYIYEMNRLLTGFDNASNTELTPEQDQYLQAHEDRVLGKAEAILYNLQDFLNILLAELYVENTTTLKKDGNNPTEDSEMDKFSGDIGFRVEHINDDTVFKGVENDSCSCSELNKWIVNKTHNGKPISKKSVIIEVKDPSKGYCRYIELTDIYSNNEGDIIEFNVGTRHEKFTWTEFQDTYGYGNNNPKHLFNVILTHNYRSYNVLKSVYYDQKSGLDSKKNNYEKGRIMCMAVLAVICTIVFNGVYTTCSAGRVNARQRIETIANNSTETTSLLHPDALTEAYINADQEIRNKQVCGNRVTGLLIIACGTILTLSLIHI